MTPPDDRPRDTPGGTSRPPRRRRPRARAGGDRARRRARAGGETKRRRRRRRRGRGGAAPAAPRRPAACARPAAARRRFWASCCWCSAVCRHRRLPLRPRRRPVPFRGRLLDPLRGGRPRPPAGLLGRADPDRHRHRLGRRHPLRVHPQPGDRRGDRRRGSTCATIWNRPGRLSGDPVFTLGDDPSIEALHAHWRRMVDGRLRSDAGIIHVAARAFTPEDAQAIAEAMLAEFEPAGERALRAGARRRGALRPRRARRGRGAPARGAPAARRLPPRPQPRRPLGRRRRADRAARGAEPGARPGAGRRATC